MIELYFESWPSASLGHRGQRGLRSGSIGAAFTKMSVATRSCALFNIKKVQSTEKARFSLGEEVRCTAHDFNRGTNDGQISIKNVSKFFGVIKFVVASGYALVNAVLTAPLAFSFHLNSKAFSPAVDSSIKSTSCCAVVRQK